MNIVTPEMREEAKTNPKLARIIELYESWAKVFDKDIEN